MSCIKKLLMTIKHFQIHLNWVLKLQFFSVQLTFHTANVWSHSSKYSSKGKNVTGNATAKTCYRFRNVNVN